MKTKSIESGTVNTNCNENNVKIGYIGARRASRDSKMAMTALGAPAPVHSGPKMAPSDRPEGLRELQEATLDPPEAAKPREVQETSQEAQEGAKVAHAGSKVEPRMRKVAKAKLFKKALVFLVFRASWLSQDDPKKTTNGSLRPKRTSRTAQEDVKTAW